MRSLARAVVSLSLLLTLTACFDKNNKPATVLQGECRIVHTPEYVIRGKTRHDQLWVDRTTEALVGGCRQPRPKARPKEWDAPPPKPATVAPTPVPRKRNRVLEWMTH